MGRCCCQAEIAALKADIQGVKLAGADPGTKSLIERLSRDVATLTTEVAKIDKDALQQRQLDAIVNGLIGIRSLILEDRRREVAAGLDGDIYRLLQTVRTEMGTRQQSLEVLTAIQWLRRDILQWLQQLYQQLWGKILISQGAVIAAITAAIALQFGLLSKAIAAQGLLFLRALAATEALLKSWVTLQHGLTQRVILAAIKGLEAALVRFGSQSKCRFEKQPAPIIRTEKVNVVNQTVGVVTEKVNVTTQTVKVTSQRVSVTTQNVDLQPIRDELRRLGLRLPTIQTVQVAYPGQSNCGVDAPREVEVLSIQGRPLTGPLNLELELLKKLYRGYTCSPSLANPEIRGPFGPITKSQLVVFPGLKVLYVHLRLVVPPAGRQARLNMDPPLNFPNAAWYSWTYADGVGVEQRVEYEETVVLPEPGARPEGIYISVFPGNSVTVRVLGLPGAGSGNIEYRSIPALEEITT